MRILAVDTSTAYLSIAVVDNGNTLAEKNEKLPWPEHGRLLVASIEELFYQESIELDSIDVFCVGRGPGSFTGLRVGISAMKGLNAVFKKRLIGISSFDAVALNVEENNVRVVCLKDARKDKIYAGAYLKEHLPDNDNVSLKLISEYRFLSARELLEELKGICRDKKKTVIIASELDSYKEAIKKQLPEIQLRGADFWKPRAANLARLLNQGSLEVSRLQEDDIEPLYLHSQYANITRPRKI